MGKGQRASRLLLKLPSTSICGMRRQFLNKAKRAIKKSSGRLGQLKMLIQPKSPYEKLLHDGRKTLLYI